MTLWRYFLLGCKNLEKKDLTYQGLPGCTRPTKQRGPVVHSLHSQSEFGPVMGLLQPAPALPEGRLVREAWVLKVVNQELIKSVQRVPLRYLAARFFLTLLEFVKLLCGGSRLICV